jgi:hypothetical protein
MKKLINIFLIFYIFFLPPSVNAKTIKESINLPMLDSCFDNYTVFSNYINCFFNNLKTSNNLSPERYKTLTDLYQLLNVLNYAIEDKYILQKNGKTITSEIYDHPFSQRYKKVKLVKVTEELECSLETSFEKFINCFYSSFRILDVYRTSSIQTKIQMESIMYNSFKLLDEKNVVMVLGKDQDFISMHSGDGFEFFYQEMDKVGTSLFDKIKENEDEIKRIITLIVISIVIAMIVQKVIIKSAAGGGGGGGGGGGQLSYSGGQASSGSSGAGSYLFSNAPAGSVLQKRWFRYGVAKGFF